MPYLMNRAGQGFEISYISVKNNQTKFCQQDISKTICVRGFKLGQLIGDDE